MSANQPRTPQPRRRIAGERRPPRAGLAPDGSTATEEPFEADAHSTRGSALEATIVRGEQVPPADAPASVPAVAPAGGPDAGGPSAPGGSGPSWLVLTVLGVLALALVATAVVLGLVTWSYREVRHDDAVDQASRTAPAAAERAASTILSYSYTSLSADEKAAARLMTPAYRAKYTKSFTKLVEPNAPKLHAKVTAEVKASGVSHADPDRVDVLVYVNQTTVSTANGGEPQVALNRAMFKMKKVGGDWLVDDITSY
jgi:Mce-associated membrane protein